MHIYLDLISRICIVYMLTLNFLFCLSCPLTSTFAASESVCKAGLFFREVGKFQTTVNPCMALTGRASLHSSITPGDRDGQHSFRVRGWA